MKRGFAAGGDPIFKTWDKFRLCKEIHARMTSDQGLEVENMVGGRST
jgi:hypothetical protein